MLEDRTVPAQVGYIPSLLYSGQASLFGSYAYITAAGHTPVTVNEANLTQANLSALSAVVIDVSGRSSTLMTNWSNVVNFVNAGGGLVINDWSPSANNSPTDDIVPGLPGLTFTETGSSNVDVLAPTHPVISGPFGTVASSGVNSLDGGNATSHGYVSTAALPAGVTPLLSFNADTTRTVSFAYQFGAGRVVYNAMPVNAYVQGAGLSFFTPISPTIQNIFMPNEVAFTVSAVNDAPVASNDSYSTNEDTILTVAAPGVLGNDTDVDGDPLSAILVSVPAHGSLTLNPDGSFTYRPADDYFGPDSFTYRANDGSVSSNVATVTLNVSAVNDAPVANPDTATTDEDTPVAIAVLDNDRPGPTNESDQTLTITQLNGTAVSVGTVVRTQHGQVVLNTHGTVTYTPDLNYNGSDGFSYTAIDSGVPPARVSASGYVTINPVNDAPVAADDGYTIAEDNVLTVPASGVLGNDSDVDGDALKVAAPRPVSNPLHGNLTFNEDGSFSYTPFADFNGEDSFTYKATDGIADSNLATVRITVTAVNDAPVARADSLTTDEDTSVGGNVLGNDTDVDSASLHAVLVSRPTYGSLTLNGDGSFTYVPNANYNGPDSFTYMANDGTADSNVATVFIRVSAVNDAPVASNDSYSTAEDTALTVAAPGVLGNDTDVDSATLTAVLVSGPSHGSLTLNADGSFTYAPAADYNGPDSFTYKVNDGSLDSNTATVSITMTAVNDAPAADAASATTDEDTATTVMLSGSDIDSTSLTFSIISGPSHGTLGVISTPSSTPVPNGTGTPGSTTTAMVVYTPDFNYNGPDSFTYKVNDGSLDSNVATVSITVTPVNDAPVGIIPKMEPPTDEDTAVTIDLAGFDVETPADQLHFAVGDPVNGSVELVDGHIARFTPAANFNGVAKGGAASFSWSVADTGDPAGTPGNALTTDPMTIGINVAAVNDAPVAQTTTLSTDEDNAVTIDLRTLVTDVETTDKDQMTFTVDGAKHGTVTLLADGHTAQFTPDANYNGSASFSYSVTDTGDGDGFSEALTVGPVAISITVNAVNDAPVAQGGSLTTAEDTAATGTLVATDIDSAMLTYSLVTNPSHGTVTITNVHTGAYTYSPAADYNGPDSFTFKASDGSLDSNVATVSITVTPVNDAPVAQAQTVTVAEDGAATGTLVATDIDSAMLTYSLVTNPSHGTVTITDVHTGAYTYSPATDYNGPDSFTFRASDGSLDSNVATVSITVTPVNDAPVAQGQSVSTAEDTARAVTLVATDVDGDNLTYTVVSGPSHGTLSGSGANLTYTPAPNYNGPDSFTFKANDGQLASGMATVSLTVSPVNDKPTAAGGSASTDEDTSINIDLTGLVSDVETADANLAYSIVSGPTAGQGTLTAKPGSPGVFTFAPAANFSGTASFTYKVTDAGDGASAALDSDTRPVILTVRPVNDKPTAAAGTTSLTVSQDAGPQTVTLSGSDVETAAAALTFTVTAAPANGTLRLTSTGAVLSAGGTFSGSPADVTYTPNAGYYGSDSFKFKVTDTGDGSSAALDSGEVTVSITVSRAAGKSVYTTADSSDPTRTALVVNGTDGDDTILVDVAPGGGLQVFIGGVSQSVWANVTGRVLVYGYGGNDSITVAGAVANEAWLYGDAGSDTLNLGNGGGIAFGGAGADTLIGGSGRDILVGGDGADRLVGNASDDILVAGKTNFDDRLAYQYHDAAWIALFAEWKRTDHTFQQRVDSIFGSGSAIQANRSNEGYYLNDSTITDADTDTVEILTGSSGEDWYVCSSKDKVTGLDAIESAEKKVVS